MLFRYIHNTRYVWANNSHSAYRRYPTEYQAITHRIQKDVQTHRKRASNGSRSGMKRSAFNILPRFRRT